MNEDLKWNRDTDFLEKSKKSIRERNFAAAKGQKAGACRRGWAVTSVRLQGGRCGAGAGLHGAAAGAEADAGPRASCPSRDAHWSAAQPRAGLDCHHR